MGNLSVPSCALAIVAVTVLAIPSRVEAQANAPAVDMDECAAVVAPEPAPGESLNDYVTKLTRERLGKAPAPPKVAEEAKVSAKESVPPAVEAKTTTAAPGSAFSDRISEAITDFLPLLQGAVDGIDTAEDKKSVTIKLGSIRLGDRGALAPRVTLREPGTFKPLAEAIDATVRDAESEALLDEVTDFSDANLAISYGYTHPADVHQPGKMFGRDYRLYRPLVDEVIIAAWEEEELARMGDAVAGAAREAVRVIEAHASELGDDLLPLLQNAKPLSELHPPIRDPLIQELARVACRQGTLQRQFSRLHLDALPELIDNQPQLVLTGAYRFRDEVLGPESWSATVRYEMGSRNFNTLLRKSAGDPAKFLGALSDLLADGSYRKEQKLVFEVTYTDVDAYHFSHEYSIGSGDDLASKLAEVRLNGSSEWKGQVLYTRFFGVSDEGSALPKGVTSSGGLECAGLPKAEANPRFSGGLECARLPRAEANPRFSAGLEFVEVDGDPSRQDRWLAHVSYDLPLSAELTVPLTVSWANKSEFLGEQDQVFGAHVGLSYKFDPK